jgi:PKD repeat protein
MRATINVYQTPKIDFVSSKDSLCLKGAFAFKTIRNLTDQFTYRWIFGDGDTSFVENPTHTYLNAGKYTINLQVSNVDNYCSASVEHPVYVKPRPVAAFSMDTTQGCSPILVKFKNKSIGANFHSWNYGDGTITNIIESDHLFKTVLKDTLFEVKLIVENASSCKDTFTSKVHVFPVPIMNFTYTPSDQCYTPMYADFTNTSIGAQSYKWYFHDNMTSVELNPTMVYQLPGKYIVKLEGENEFRCMSSISHEVIKYPKPKADFTSDKKDGCVPLSISLTNKSQGASKYSWDFGDGNAKNTTDATTIYPIAGKYNVRLIVENSDKCKDTLILPIEAFPVPTPNFVFQRSDTCATPMVTNFTNTSTGALYYDWDFDNGLVATITNPKTTYTIPKDYNVKLTATNEYNCSISIQKTVTLLQKPAAEFTTNINIGCIPLVIDFKNTSTFGKYYSWEFDDGNVSNQQDTKHIFKTSGQDSIKKFQVKLIVEGSNGCKDTIEHAITTMPLPVPNFTYMTTDPCYNPMNAYFQNNSLYAKKYDWIFGNGQLSTETNPAANYLKAGVYNVDLIATNKFECKDTIRKTVQMNQKPKAQFSMDKDKGCIPLSVSFLNESLYANYSKWNFDDGNNSANTSTNNLFTKVGELNIELIVENTLGCKDTVRHKLTTFPIPVPAFNFTTTDPCYIPMITQFNNQSTGAVGYAWNFGNNQTSNLDNPSVKYDASNVYKVKLDAINEYACTTSVSKFVTVNNRPKSDFYSDKVEGCMPLKVDFTNKSIGYKFLNWNFGDTNYSTAENPNHVFLKDGKYQINLVTENSIGCKDTIAKTILVHPLPVAKFSITNSDPCFQPMEVKTYNQSTGATNYDWDFGDAITSFETHPIVNYTKVNNHLIVLNAKNEYGCLSTAKQFIRNYNTPKLTPKELPSGFCEWDQLFYSINSLFINKITWDMGNGAKKEGGTINYTYKKQGNYTITVIGEGEGGCADTVVLTQQIIVHPDPVADFNAEGIKIDDLLNGTMVFKNASKQADYYTWFFGDGDTSNVNSPTHKFHHSGDFSTTLIATNSYNCVDTITKTIHVDFFKGLYVANAIYLGHQDFQVSHFLPKGVGLFEYEITIYDDWGNLIWRSTAIDEYGRPTEAWDGTYKGEYVQQDSYVWKVNAIFRDNSVWEGKEYQPTIYKRAGTVTVIK